MRETYGVLFPRFWEGTTGRQIQGKGRDAVILAAYLASCRHANMIGLYELPLVFLERELAVLTSRPYILQAFLALQEVGYAQYDMGTEHTWVREMARIRVGLSSGETIDPGDNKHKAVLKLYATAKANPFLGPFFEHYRTTLRLTEGRIGPPSVPISTVDAQIPSRSKGTRKGLRRGLGDPSEQVQEQKQVQKQRSGAGAGTGTEKAAAAPRDAKPTEDPNPKANIESITALFTKEIFQLLGPTANPVDLRDAAMERCRALGIPCDKDAIHRAYESALHRRQLKARVS